MLLLRRLKLYGLAFLLVVLPPGIAQAQDYGLSGGSSAGGGFAGGQPRIGGEVEYRMKGVRFGSSQLHPSLMLEFGYDSNVFYSSGGTAPAGQVTQETEYDSLYLGINPTVFLGNSRGGEKAAASWVRYAVSLGYTYKRYLQDLGVRREKDFHSANVGAFGNFLPRAMVSFDMFDAFVRTTEPRTLVNDMNFDRDRNEAGAGVTYKPGGGLMSFRLGYRFIVDYFEDPNLNMANFYAHHIDFKAKWKFFPQTSWWLGATWQYIHYWATGVEPSIRNHDSKPLRVMMGLTGRLSPKLTINAGAGYGYTWYDSGADYKYGIIGHVDVAWQPLPKMKLTAGFKHGFKDSLWANYYMSDSAYLGYIQEFFGRLQLGVTFRWLMATYEGATLAVNAQSPHCAAGGFCDRTDQIFLTQVLVRFHIYDWLWTGVGYTLLINNNPYYEIHTDTSTGTQFRREAKFVKHRAYLQVTATF